MTGWRASFSVAMLTIALVVPASVATAGSLDEAKRTGRVGEQVDGYLGAIDPGAAALVEEINAKRRVAYQEIAKKNGIQVETVEALAGQKLVRKTPRGQMVKGADGKWRPR